jgi:hypothetical protein
MVAKDKDRKLTSLDAFLSEWGFTFSDSTVKVPTGVSGGLTEAEKMTDVISAEYIKDTESYAYAIYSAFASLSSAPKTVFSGAGYIECSFGATDTVTEPGSLDRSKVYSSFLTSPSSSVPYGDGGAGEEGSYDLAAVTTRTVFDSVTAEYTYSYVFCANSANFFSYEMLSNASYSNFDIVSALVNNMSRMDIYASSSVGGVSMNNADKYGGKRLVSTLLSAVDTYVYGTNNDTGITEIVKTNKAFTKSARTTITVCVFILPVITLAAGIFVSVKRKFK